MHSLVLQISQDALQFYYPAVADAKATSYGADQRLSFQKSLEQAATEEAQRLGGIEHVDVLVEGLVQPVPMNDFAEDDISKLYQYVVPTDEPLSVFYDTLPASNAVLLFALPRMVARSVEAQFPGCIFRSAQTVPLANFARQSAKAVRTQLHVVLRGLAADVALFAEGRLLFCNTFEVQAPQDVVYFALGAAKTLGFDIVADEVFLHGNAPQVQSVSEAMKPYVAHLTALPALPDVPFGISEFVSSGRFTPKGEAGE
ncbi:MAG: DUF3822 family protein [Alloprevotella sp.]|nr:DUF3822 family protein [Alloprevotella sp.]